MRDTPAVPSSEDRLDSWKDISAYLRREVRTVQLWEKNEGLPIHRHVHTKRGSVYAYKAELDAWWNSRAAALNAQSTTVSPGTSRRWAILVAAVCVFLLGTTIWLKTQRRSMLRDSEPRTVPLTSDPGREMGASFSPDGNQVAFAWKREEKTDFDIYVKVVGSDRELQLTDTPASDVDPNWSPDGKAIAFYRSRPDRTCAIYIVSPLGGPERLVSEMSGRSSCGFWPANPKLSSAQSSWSPDSKWLARAGIFLTSLETGEHRMLTSAPAAYPDQYPAISPDGRTLAFVRTVDSGVQDIYVVPLAGGRPARVSTEGQRIFGLTWTADGRELVYSSGKWDWGEARLWRVSPSGGAPRRLIAGGESAWLPTISRQGGRLAFTRKISDTNIWQVRAGTSAGQPDTPVRLIASTQGDGVPAFSPDGRRITFTSDRSGTWQVWVCNRDGSNATQLTSFSAPGAGLGTWSPDGSQIAFDASVRGNRDIYVIPASGGAFHRLTSDNTAEVSPVWSPDGQWIYFASTRTGRHEIWKMKVQGGSAIQITKHGGQRPMPSPDGEFVYYEKGPSFATEFEPWRVPVNGGEERLVLEKLGSRWWLANNGLYLYEQEQSAESPGSWTLQFFDINSRKKQVVARLEGMPLLGHRPAVSSDRRMFLYTQLDLYETDLVLIENFQ